MDSLSALDLLFNHVDTPIIAVDAQQQILFCNQAALTAFAVAVEDPIGKPLRHVIRNADLWALFDRDERPENGLWREITLPGDNRVLTAQLVGIEGIGYLAILQDITHLKELNRIKTALVTTISRDLRSPLTAIIGYVELLERMGPLNEQQRDFIGRIIFGVHSITALLNDLLELDKIEAGFDTERTSVHMQAIVDYALQGMYQQAEQKAHHVEFVAADELPPVMGNPIQLRHLVSQLVDNAIRYTPEKGYIRAELSAQSGFVILRIADNGIGILPEDQPYIFSKFYRASNVSEIAGTGLGLSIVQSIVEQHQGRIWVESQVNEGTTFTVMLPCYGDASSGTMRSR
jgi:two-component system NtrC family sensor kinase